MTIKALIFDNFGVLMDEVYGSLRNLLPVEARTRLFDIFTAADSGQIDAAAQRQQLIQLLQDYRLDGSEAIAAAIQRASRNQPLFDFIASHRNQYKMAMLSNVSAVVWNYYTPDELTKYFDQTILSYQVKMAKPDHRIYQLAADRLGVALDECVFTDDNPDNVQAANDCGMHGIVFHGFDDYLTKLREIERA